MPITRKQFELEIDSKIEEWMKKIYTFLAEHKDVAFGRRELWETLCGESEERRAWDTALSKLVEMGAVERRAIRGTDYHSYGPFPLEV